ncbi:MAG: methionyl-tRNA formyltransferase [Ruminococcaceae bacterium]|nr:methionyl-tRNA formyltransferase [Oscillospiraceae bacterium]
MKVVFMGTPDFAVPCLERLLQEGHEVSLVVTRADRPKGRGHKMTPPPVKECALSHNLPVLQPTTLKDDAVYEALAAEQADVFVVVAYGRLLPQRVLDLPRYGCINIHASLLPKYRGAAPIQWAVLNGESESGVTSMQMDAGLDTGDMLLTAHVPITADMTGGELHDVLSLLGADVLADTLTGLANGTLQPQKQGETTTEYAAMLDKSLCPLDFRKTAPQLHDQVRGLNPWPSASCRCDGKLLKVHRSAVGGAANAPCGTVVKLDPLTVACGENTSLVLLEIQAEGSKRMAAVDFLRGHALPLGTILE